MSAFIYIVGLNQQKWGEDHDLNTILSDNSPAIALFIAEKKLPVPALAIDGFITPNRLVNYRVSCIPTPVEGHRQSVALSVNYVHFCGL